MMISRSPLESMIFKPQTLPAFKNLGTLPGDTKLSLSQYKRLQQLIQVLGEGFRTFTLIPLTTGLKSGEGMQTGLTECFMDNSPVQWAEKLCIGRGANAIQTQTLNEIGLISTLPQLSEPAEESSVAQNQKSQAEAIELKPQRAEAQSSLLTLSERHSPARSLSDTQAPAEAKAELGSKGNKHFFNRVQSGEQPSPTDTKIQIWIWMASLSCMVGIICLLSALFLNH